MTKIYIDAGHGGSDPGATANGLREKDLTLKIAKHIRDYLKNYNCSVKMSRTGDKTLSLAQRTNDANRWGADYFLSVHINAGGGTGYEDYIYNQLANSSKTAKLRDTIHAEVVKAIGSVENRGKKKANFHVLRESKMSAMLSENLFIDRKADANKLKSSSFLNKVAKGHAKGLAKAFGLKKKSSNSKPSKPSKPATSKNKADLIVDGKWGKDTTRSLQQSLGTTVDGILSDQSKNAVTNALYGNTAEFGSGKKGSMVIKALQKKVKSNADGLLGPDTVRKLQKHLGTVQDGKLSRPSLVVKELQKKLNAGTF